MLLEDVLQRGRNNFDLLRLIAACMVVIGHSYAFYPQSGWDPLLVLTHHESTGSLAVFCFFLISGMLVSASWERDPVVWRYLLHRAARLWPALLVNTLLLALLIVPLWDSDRSYGQMLGLPQLWRWLLHVVLLGNAEVLAVPHSFVSSHLPYYPNPVVWTLPIELKAYLFVLVLGLIGSRDHAWRFWLAMALALAGLGQMTLHPSAIAFWADWGRRAIGYTAPPILLFLVGILLYRWRRQVPIHAWPVPLLGIAAYMLRDSVFGEALWLSTWMLLLLWLAAWPALRRWAPAEDRSYGVYLYAFPVQQMLACLSPHLNHWLSLILVLPATWTLAGWSWHFVERPALRWAQSYGAGRSLIRNSCLCPPPKQIGG